MQFTNDELKAKYLNKRFIVGQNIGPFSVNNIFTIDNNTIFSSSFSNSGYEISVKNLLNETTGSRVTSNRDFREMMYVSILLDDEYTRVIKESTFNKINTNSKFDKYKGKLILEIKNNSIILSNNILNILQVSNGDSLAFYTSSDDKLFIAKSLEKEGITPSKNKITGNDAKNIIEIFRSTFGDKNMYSIQINITKDLDNPDYNFYEIIPAWDSNS
jgi:hypothetical protein